MEIFYREKAFHAGKKIRKNDSAPSEKIFLLRPCSCGIFMKPPPQEECESEVNLGKAHLTLLK